MGVVWYQAPAVYERNLPPTHPQPYPMATVYMIFLHLGQLYGSFGESEGCGTRTILPVGSCFKKLESLPAASSRPVMPSSLRGDVPGTCSSLRSSSTPRGIVVVFMSKKYNQSAIEQKNTRNQLNVSKSRSSQVNNIAVRRFPGYTPRLQSSQRTTPTHLRFRHPVGSLINLGVFKRLS